jgi:hypothetical protein
MNEKLAAVVEKYRSHPEFLGIDILDPNQPGAIDDTLLHLAARTGAVEDIEVLSTNRPRLAPASTRTTVTALWRKQIRRLEWLRDTRKD